MRSKRGRIQIIFKILSLARQGMKKTQLMYEANLNHRQLSKYLDILVSKQLVLRKRGLYHTTDGGCRFLVKYKELLSLIERQNVPSSLPNHL